MIIHSILFISFITDSTGSIWIQILSRTGYFLERFFTSNSFNISFDSISYTNIISSIYLTIFCNTKGILTSFTTSSFIYTSTKENSTTSIIIKYVLSSCNLTIFTMISWWTNRITVKYTWRTIRIITSLLYTYCFFIWVYFNIHSFFTIFTNKRVNLIITGCLRSIVRNTTRWGWNWWTLLGNISLIMFKCMSSFTYFTLYSSLRVLYCELFTTIRIYYTYILFSSLNNCFGKTSFTGFTRIVLGFSIFIFPKSCTVFYFW